MSSWSALVTFLENVPKTQTLVRLTFEKIEEITGRPLRESAYKHRQYWANDITHSHARNWLRAGWVTEEDPRLEKVVTFKRRQNGETERLRMNAKEDANPIEKLDVGSPSVSFTSLGDSKAKTLDDKTFIKVCDIKPCRDATGLVIKDYPQSKYANPRNLPLHKYGGGPFCKFRIPNELRGEAGVYILTCNDKIVYIGECEDLVRRYNAGYGHISPRNCYKDGRQTNCRINTHIFDESSRGSRLELWFSKEVGGKESRRILERKLKKAHQPCWNKD